MSRDLYVCLLDLEEFRLVMGSRDETILERVLSEQQERISDHDVYFAKDFSPYLSLADAISQIIHGKVDKKATPRFQYEHAAALIADTLGEPLDSDLFMETHPEFWEEIDTIIRRRLRAAHLPKAAWPTLEEVLDRGPYLGVPLDPEMPLGTGYLTDKEVQKVVGAADKVDLEGAYGLESLTWPKDALEAARVYRGWVREAAKKNLGLFFHC